MKLKAESWWGTHNVAIINSKDQKQWFERVQASNNQLVLIAMHKGLEVAYCIYSDIDWISRSCCLSGSVAEESRELSLKCFTTGVDFCFEMLNMNRFSAEVASFNQVLPMNLSLGMKIEGVKRQAVYRSGKYYDSFVLGMLREDWLAMPRIQEYNGVCNLNFKTEVSNKIIEFNKRFLDNRNVQS